MKCHENETNVVKEESSSEQTNNKHTIKMVLMHIIPMIILFGFYDFFNEPGNEIWKYSLIIVIIVIHVRMMGQMSNHNE